jgi:hypothetical protein
MVHDQPVSNSVKPPHLAFRGIGAYLLVCLALISSRVAIFVPLLDDIEWSCDMDVDKAFSKPLAQMMNLPLCAHRVDQDDLFLSFPLEIWKDTIADPSTVRLPIKAIARFNERATVVLAASVNQHLPSRHTARSEPLEQLARKHGLADCDRSRNRNYQSQ